MCGVSGFIESAASRPLHELHARATRMADSLHHRGPDSEGVWCDEQIGLALGHRRLAIIDLSEHGRQPMASSDNRYLLTYNGEIYNFRELRRDLEQTGARFRGSSDTEVVVEGFAKWGIRHTLQRARGMFALAVWDRTRRVLVLARDRIGEKPLYYGWINDNFFFGSELKALRTHPDFVTTLNRGAVTLFLRYGYIPAPFSIYEGISKLPAGTTIEVDPRQPHRINDPEPYWSLEDTAGDSPSSIPPAEVPHRLEELLTDSIRGQMISDVPLGAFLSGGIDSSTVVALMQAQSNRPIRTFSIGFAERNFNEATYAKAVAHGLGTDHTELYVTPREAMDVIPMLPSMYDEPFADSSQIPTYLVSSLARDHVTVSLSGDGGDELFGGYPRYDRHERTWRAVQRIPGPARRAAASALRAVPSRFWAMGLKAASGILPRRISGGLPSARAPHTLADVLRSDTPESAYLLQASHWRRPGDVVLRGSEPPVTMTDPRAWLDTDEIVAWAMYVDSLQYLPDDILVKVDRASMARSLEVRVPMLDHRVVEFAWSLPLSVKRNNGSAKWPLKQILYKHVPRHLVDRPKMGFGVPVHEWLRGPLRDWAEGLLAKSRIQKDGLFDPEPIRRVWAEHLEGRRDREYLIWDVLMLQAWLDEVSP